MVRGKGFAHCHHGEILQGVFRDENGSLCRGLVTLPLSALGTHAEFLREPGTSPRTVTVTPAGRTKASRAATLAVELCGALGPHPPSGGHLRLRSEIPIGLGMGSSTSDILAAVRAVASSFGVRLAPAVIAALAVRAEQASDPLMLPDEPLLFAQREGRVIEVLGEALPSALVVGCTTGCGDAVDTLALPAPDFDGADLVAFERLRIALRQAIADSDVAALGRVSTESARLNQRVLPKAEFEVLTAIADASGAAGVQVAHSGNVAGLLFDPYLPRLSRRLRECVHALRDNGITVTRIFDSGVSERKCARVRPHRGFDRPAGSGARRRTARLPAVRDDEGGLGAGRGTAPARPGRGSSR